MAPPPRSDGGDQLTAAWPLPATASTLVGAPGGATTVKDAESGALQPTALCAVTEMMYWVPTVRPVKVAFRFVRSVMSVLCEKDEPDEIVTLYRSTVAPLGFAGFQVAEAEPAAVLICRPLGVPGTPAGMKLTVAAGPNPPGL